MEMTPKEKAKELMEKCYSKYNNIRKDKIYSQEQKRMANLVVDEILNANPSYEDYGGDGWKIIDKSDYWKNVKKEIKLL